MPCQKTQSNSQPGADPDSHTVEPPSQEARQFLPIQGLVALDNTSDSSVEAFWNESHARRSSVEPEPDTEDLERAISRGFVVYESDIDSSVEPDPDTEKEPAISHGSIVYESDPANSRRGRPGQALVLALGFGAHASNSCCSPSATSMSSSGEDRTTVPKSISEPEHLLREARGGRRLLIADFVALCDGFSRNS
ncbi:hypothetical protein C8T65DRAFT_700349 [Cerioporus squamosus]|nr:hypothetical protein C8T65DRAFT_700349 [Cerioporus squamosus]